MLKFNQLPPTAKTTEVDPVTIRFLAHGIPDRGICVVAEACAAMVLANTSDMEEVAAIGQKIGSVIARSQASKEAGEGDSFVQRYEQTVNNIAGRTK